MGSSII